MSERTRRRPWLAALLALVVSGLGHAYLRRWARGLGWYLAVAAAVFVFVPESAISGALAGDPPAVSEVAPAAAVVVASVVDAYVVAVRHNRGSERDRDRGRVTDSPDAVPGPDGASAEVTGGESESESGETIRCPECGRETDPTFDFCQWCAEPVGEGDA
ncbi:zinc ribbon domain-containing protein [Halorubrum sp. Atlit-8R]|uniref:zinc ribbon domain-containing protein n=1 Tax=unclassified Halorubrum TaxID=2642239 RepID=UPI000EF20CB9|nr:MULTISPECIES: zinc ribbon domain-containing protein [unclassified Halorubrum]RLM70910.1 zinc ribbon domain-containing protein [Halorubrum sp. Atlit-9R]RLM71778.1 zinc ribbon domain-containing protein [Halorubrum sp. Atlit-9R]RLM82937.1 zinc ribbon domain-containing protein [Halorubrum sp. Atlit-8R]